MSRLTAAVPLPTPPQEADVDRRRLSRAWMTVLGATAIATVLLVAMAAPALAHGGGTDAANYVSRITEAPALDGVRWRVFGGDELLWVDNSADQELIVYGYDQEPYLRIGPGGVWQNRNSAATYLNEEPLGEVRVPDTADTGAPPEWEQVSNQPRFAWHDHRIRFMGPGLHPRVTDPAVATHLMDWTVPFHVDGQDFELAGELEWVPGPPSWPWLVLGLGLTLPALVGLRTRPVGGRWPGLARPAAVILGVAVLANLAFLIDDVLALPLPAVTKVFAAAQTALFLALGAFGARRAWQGGDGAFTALGVGAGALFVGQGILKWSVLSASQLSTVFPAVVPRAIAGVNLMLIVPLGVVAFLGTKRLLPEAEDAGTEEPAAPPTG